MPEIYSAMTMECTESTFPHFVSRFRSQQMKRFSGQILLLTLAPGSPSSPGNPMAPGSPCERQTHRLLCQDKKSHHRYRLGVVSSPLLQPRMMPFLSRGPESEREFGDELVEGKTVSL